MRMGPSIAHPRGCTASRLAPLAWPRPTVAQAMALSLLMFTGGSQFAFIGVIAGGGGGAAALSAATLLGVRNGVYGMQMQQLFAPRGWRRVVMAQITIDESAATALGQPSPTSSGAVSDCRRRRLRAVERLHAAGRAAGDALATRAASGWTARPWRPFWACCGCARRGASHRAGAGLRPGDGAGHPQVPPGLPILLAAPSARPGAGPRPAPPTAGRAARHEPVERHPAGPACAFATKLAGYAIPARWLHSPRMLRVAGALTVALLASLTVMNTFAQRGGAGAGRPPGALAVAALVLRLRAPFLLRRAPGGGGGQGVVRWAVN